TAASHHDAPQGWRPAAVPLVTRTRRVRASVDFPEVPLAMFDRTAIQQLRDERARVLAQVDDVIATSSASAHSAFLPADTLEHDTPAARADMLSEMITVAERRVGGDGPVPAANLIGPGSRAAAFGLDALLWATAERVAAGTFDRTG